MGRFERLQSDEVRKNVILGKPALVDDDSDFFVPEPKGARVAETGTLLPRYSSPLKKIQSSVVLGANRLFIFGSPEYRQRVEEDNGIPASRDVTRSPIGLLRTALNPQYRDAALGDVWQYTDGCRNKRQARDRLIDEAKESFDKEMRRGKYARQGSLLRNAVAVRSSTSLNSSPANKELKPTSPNLRRSERIRARRSLNSTSSTTCTTTQDHQ